MTRNYYDVGSLRQELAALEERYGLPSEELVELRRADRVPSEIPSFDAFVWADLYHEARCLSATQAELRPAG